MDVVTILVSIAVGAVVLSVLLTRLTNLRRSLMGQFEDLQAAVGQLGVDLNVAVARVEAMIAELGEPDPDLSAQLAAIRDASERLDALAAEPPPPQPEPGPAPEPEPAPEPAPEDGGGGGGEDGGGGPVSARR